MKHHNRYLSRIYRGFVAALVLLPAFATLHAEGNGNKTTTTPKVSILKLHADLDGAAALPENSEAATGDLIATYDKSTHVLKFYARFVGLSGQATNARFHGPAAFDRTAAPTVAAPRPEARLVEGTAWLDPEEEQDLLDGRWYFNVTTQKHPGGEIRGMVHLQPSETP